MNSILRRVYFSSNIPKDGLVVKFFSQFFCLGWVSINEVIVFRWPCWFALVLSAGWFSTSPSFGKASSRLRSGRFRNPSNPSKAIGSLWKLPVRLGPVSSVFVTIIPIDPVPTFINELYWVKGGFISNVIWWGYVMPIPGFFWEEPNHSSSDLIREIIFLSHWCPSPHANQSF